MNSEASFSWFEWLVMHKLVSALLTIKVNHIMNNVSLFTLVLEQKISKRLFMCGWVWQISTHMKASLGVPGKERTRETYKTWFKCNQDAVWLIGGRILHCENVERKEDHKNACLRHYETIRQKYLSSINLYG